MTKQEEQSLKSAATVMGVIVATAWFGGLPWGLLTLGLPVWLIHKFYKP